MKEPRTKEDITAGKNTYLKLYQATKEKEEKYEKKNMMRE